jgi:hypothetical protein
MIKIKKVRITLVRENIMHNELLRTSYCFILLQELVLQLQEPVFQPSELP